MRNPQLLTFLVCTWLNKIERCYFPQHDNCLGCWDKPDALHHGASWIGQSVGVCGFYAEQQTR